MSIHRTVRRASLAATMIVCGPGSALAAAPSGPPKLTPMRVFIDSPPSLKILMIVLVAATVAAVLVTVRKVASGPHLNGGSAYLSALRLGGPLLGLLGAAYTALTVFIGAANIHGTPPLAAYAPGFTEGSLTFGLGLMAGVVAVIGHWIIEARIDRAVLRP